MKTVRGEAQPGSEARSSPTRSADLAGQLRTSIMCGNLLPGSQLRLDQLRETYGMSLSPVREALLRLAGEGYVVFEDQRGFRVAPVSRENLAEISKLRALLEPFALRHSIENGGEDWEDLVVARFHQLNRIERTDDYGVERWEIAHRKFHLALTEACGMSILLEQCEMLNNLNDRYRRIFLRRNAHDRNVPKEHAAIFEATIARNGELAGHLLAEHVSRTGRALLSYLIEKGVAD